MPVVADITWQENYFSMSDPGVGRFLVAFTVQGVVYIALLFVIELQCVRSLCRLLTSLCRGRKRVGCVCLFLLPSAAASLPWEQIHLFIFYFFIDVFFYFPSCIPCASQLPLIEDAAVLPEDRDVAEERKRVLECQPVVESMVGSPLILQELSKVRKQRRPQT